MTQIHYKSAFQKISEDELDKWLEFNKTRLIGSAIFTCQDTLTSKLVRWGERHLFAGRMHRGIDARMNSKCHTSIHPYIYSSKFVPSHTGSIIEYANELHIFDMKPPRASVQPLKGYLLNTDEDYCLVMRDFPLDEQMFSLNLQFHISEFYPYLSALRSVFTKRQSKWNMHCSELHARMLDLCGHKFPDDFNFECTPDELLQILKGGVNEFKIYLNKY